MVQGHILSWWESHGTELTVACHIVSTVKEKTMNSFTQLTFDAVQDCGIDNGLPPVDGSSHLAYPQGSPS